MDALLTASSSYSEDRRNKSDCSIGLLDGKKGGNSVQLREKSIAKSSSTIGMWTEEEELELAKAEMTKMRDENSKLKNMLEQIKSDYQSLLTRFIEITQPQKSNRNIAEETELVSLTLGRNEEITKTRETSTLQLLNDENLKSPMDFNLEKSKSGVLDNSRENSSDSEMVKEEIWSPSKVLKTMRTSGNDEEVSLQQPNTKRARVSVRARCDSATMNDGCQWRKYGQKTSKGNPCPRAYFRCTVSPGCPVRKQVQRCMDDMSILITTYEGTHNHPLPFSATAMAFTTSSAASMLLSGSSTSTTVTPPSIYEGLNNNNYSRPNSFYLPNTSPQGCSTITLDLTTSSRFSSSHTNGYLDYKTMGYHKTPLNSQFCPSSYSGTSNQVSSQKILTETLTKAIISDPSLRSVINAAISSMVRNVSEYKSDIQHAPLPFSL